MSEERSCPCCGAPLPPGRKAGKPQVYFDGNHKKAFEYALEAHARRLWQEGKTTRRDLRPLITEWAVKNGLDVSGWPGSPPSSGRRRSQKIGGTP